MDKKKIIINWKLVSVLVVALFIVMSPVIMAAAYKAIITVDNSGGPAYTNIPVAVTMNNSYLGASGQTSTTQLDVNIKTASNVSVAMMPTNNRTWFNAPTVAANSKPTFTWSSGNTLKTSHEMLFGNGGYATIIDVAKLEPHDNFALTISLYIPDEDCTIFDKENAIRWDYNHTTDVLTATIGTYASPDYTLTATNVTPGEHIIKLNTESTYSGNMKQPILGYNGAISSGTSYLSLIGVSTQTYNSDNEYRVKQVVASAGTLSNLTVSLATAPAGSESYTFTVRKNGVDTDATVTISGSNTYAQDLSHTISVSAGDLLSLKSVGSATAVATKIRISMTYVSTTAQHTIMNIGTTTAGDAGTYRYIIPTSGTIKDLYIKATDSAPGTGKSYTVTLYKNSSSQSLTTTLSDLNTVASDLIHSVTVEPEDIIWFVASSSGTPSSSYSVGWVFSPDIDGESIMLNVDDGSLQMGFAYAGISGQVTHNLLHNTSAIKNVSQAGVIKKFYVNADSSPIYQDDFTIRKNGTNTDLAASMLLTDTISDTTHSITTDDDDIIDMTISGIGYAQFCWSLVYYLAHSTDEVSLELYVDNMVTSVDTQVITTAIPDNSNNWVFYPNPYFNYIKLETGN